MKIADNGKGFEMIAGNTGNGLFNMKQRTEKWKGIFLLNSTVGNGTAVVIEMPVLR
jgi:signal transduction histidine kinase